MKFRQFNEDIERIAAECRSKTFTDEPFEITGDKQGGGTGAVPVRMLNSGRMAWVKPAGQGNQNLRDVATEKIASDICYDLTLAAAPVILSTQTNGKDLHPIVAISYETLPAGKPWDAGMPPEIRDQLKVPLSAMLALLTWIDDHDHIGGSNMQYEVVNGVARPSFYDFAHSMTHGWNLPGPAPVRDCWKNRPHPFDLQDAEAVSVILERIEGFPVKELERIIAGPPADCLTPEIKRALTDALIQRRTEVRGLMDFAG